MRGTISSRLKREDKCACGHIHEDGIENNCTAYNCPCQVFRVAEGEWERAYDAYAEFLIEREMRVR